MGPIATIIRLAVAGVLLVVQNLLMVRITASVSPVIVTLVLHSGVGLVLLLSTLSARDGLGAMAKAWQCFSPWSGRCCWWPARY